MHFVFVYGPPSKSRLHWNIFIHGSLWYNWEMDTYSHSQSFPFRSLAKEDLNKTTTEWRRWVGGWMDDKTHDQWYRPAWAGQIFTWNKAGEATQQGHIRAPIPIPARQFKQKLLKRVLVLELDGLLSLCVFSVVRLVYKKRPRDYRVTDKIIFPSTSLTKLKYVTQSRAGGAPGISRMSVEQTQRRINPLTLV